MATVVAHRFTDPGCPWAYSFRPAHTRLLWRFGEQIDWGLTLIGLAETGADYEARGYTPEGRAVDQRKFQRRFGMPFIYPLKRIAGTSRACRAIIGAREIAPELGERALRALEFLHFTTTRLLDEDSDLAAVLGSVPGLDGESIVAAIDSPEILRLYEQDRAFARSAEGAPVHVQNRHATTDGPVRYTAPSVVFEDSEGRRIEVGGFQPFEAYDTALANLDPSLSRRPPPQTAAEVLHAFPDGLTTAEAAAVLRPSELEDADLPAAVEQLVALAGGGAADYEPLGADAIWRPR